MIKDVAKWLKTAPRKNETVEIQNGKNKVTIIRQKFIESLLDELTEQNWSTRNFQFSRTTEQSKTMCDASLELVVTYCISSMGPLAVPVQRQITRVLVGAVSFDVSFFGNDHVANTAKSLCISNAASDLGRRFGKDLNPKEASMMILGIKSPVNDTDNQNKILESLKKIK